MMISDLTTYDNSYGDLEEGLPTWYEVEVNNSKISFIESSNPDNDPVEEINTVQDCERQSVLNSMNAIGIASQYEATWTEAMQLCGNDICSQQCVEAVAAVPYMFANEAALTMSNGSPNTSTTSTNLMIFYLGGTGGISSGQATWLRGHSSTLAPIYLYLVSRDTELDCGYKSASGIAGRIARAYIDDLVTYSTLGSLENFACIMEEYHDCIKADYARAELAFNATMDLYNEFGASCATNCPSQIILSGRSSSAACSCLEADAAVIAIIECTGASVNGATEIRDIVGTECDNASDYCKCVNTIVLTTCISQNKFHLVQNAEFDPEWGAWQGLANFRPTDPRVTSRLEQLEWELQTIDQANGPIVNLDYFAVKITQLPLVNGQQATASEVFEDLRLRFLNFDEGCNSTFAFAENVDAQTWQSNDAIPSAFRIAIADDGNVIPEAL